MKRLSTDRTLAPYAAQFVPVKLDIGSPAYRKWRKDLKMTGKVRTYPYVFIVRSDGETLFGNGGLTSKTPLIPLMESALQTSGQSISAREAETLSTSAERFVSMSGSGDIAGAIKAINRANRIGVPGEIPSFAESAIKLNKLVKEVATEVLADLEELESKIESSSTAERLDAVLASMKLTSAYGGLKILKPAFGKFRRKLSSNKEISQLVKEARVINSAVTAKTKSSTKRALDKLEALIESTEIEEIKTVAQATLDDLSS